MDSQQIYSIFVSHLTNDLSTKITDEFKTDFIQRIELKKDTTFLKNDALAADIASHCNLCNELCFPLYLEDDCLREPLTRGLNSYTDEMLERCNQLLENHILTVTSIEKTEDKLKLHFKSAYFPAETNECTMLCNFPDFQFTKYTKRQCVIYTGWVQLPTDSENTYHLYHDTDLTPNPNLCSTSYCIKKSAIILYYIKYILNDYDYYLEKRHKYLNGQIKKPSGEVKNLDLLLDQIQNPKQRYLYAFLEGEEGLNQVEICNYIAQQLHVNNKVESPTFYRYSLINLADELAKNPTGIKYDYQTLDRDHLYVLTGIDEFMKSKEFNSTMYAKKCDHIIYLLSQIRERRYILIRDDKEALHKFLRISLQVEFIFKDNVVSISNLSPDEMYQEFCDKTTLDVRNNPDFYREFVEYIAFNHMRLPIKNHELVNYLVTYCEKNNALILPPSQYKKEAIEQMLDNIIGLEAVKQKIDDFKKYVIFQQKAKALGKEIQTTNFHMIYTGNPGTGKTTVARLMTTMLYQLGIIKEDKLTEVERKDLVGQYIGQTAPKTAAVIDKAMGGVLFIDEAYTLASPSGKDYGKEAIATLIKAMEDHSDELIVIFAGYKREMKDFLAMNPGIASRIGYNFYFPDYSPEELAEIYQLSLHKMGFQISKLLLPKVIQVMRYFSEMDNFGNGRFAKKYVQETLILHSRLHPDNFTEILETDLPSIEHMSSVVALNDAEYQIPDYSEEDLYTIAVHEIGHAFVYYYLTKDYNIEKISILQEKAYTNGYVKLKNKMPNIKKRSDYINRIKVSLAGMCAEIVFFGEPSDGNSQDLKTASDIAAIMMTQIGAFDDKLFVTSSIDSEKEQYLNSLLNKYYKETIGIVKENYTIIERLARKLVKSKTMYAEEFKSYINLSE